MYLSIVIPVYCSEKILPLLYTKICTVLANNNFEFEIIFVEDCGADNSWKIIQDIQKADIRVKAIKLARNYGQHNALLCGIRAARGEVIITMDDDLQNPPEEIPNLIQEISNGYDVVYGTPNKETHSFLRNLASKITKHVLKKSMGAETAGRVSAFRAFKTSIRDGFATYRSPTVNIDVLLTWGTSHFTSVKVHQDTRVIGKSGYTIKKLITHAFNMMTGFSTTPLQIASILGLVFSAFGFLLLLYILGKYMIYGSVVAGFSFIASIISIFSGVQLFTLGIFGEYLARMHFRTMEKPAYLIRYNYL